MIVWVWCTDGAKNLHDHDRHGADHFHHGHARNPLSGTDHAAAGTGSAAGGVAPTGDDGGCAPARGHRATITAAQMVAATPAPATTVVGANRCAAAPAATIARPCTAHNPDMATPKARAR